MTRSRFVCCLVLILLQATAVFAQQSSIVASVDREQIRVNESFTYRLTIAGRVSGRPDVSALTRDFDLLRSGSSTNIQIINGQTTQITELQIELMPREVGEFELPPIEIAGLISNPINVEILPPLTDAQAQADVFIEVELDRTEAYVLAQAIFTLKLFVGIDTGREGLSTLPVEGGEAIVERLGNDSEYQTVRGERLYRVRERKFAIFPQTTGVLSIGPVAYEATVQPSLGFSRRQSMRSDVLQLTVLPAVLPPVSHPDAVWLPAQDLRIEEDWRDGVVFDQGVPRTRELTVIATGLLETQLPELSLAESDGLRQYADQPELTREITEAGIEARRIDRYAVIAQQAGMIEIPSVELPWWNVDEDRWEVATIESRVVEIEEADVIESQAETATAMEPDSAVESNAGIWPWLTGIFAFAWAATVAAWMFSRRDRREHRSKRATARPTSSRMLFKQLSAACRVDDAQRVRDLLLEWAGRQFADDPPANLGALADRLSGPISDEIQALESALYGREGGSWQGQRLAELLKSTQSVSLSSAEPGQDPLVPLYR